MQCVGQLKDDLSNVSFIDVDGMRQPVGGHGFSVGVTKILPDGHENFGSAAQRISGIIRGTGRP